MARIVSFNRGAAGSNRALLKDMDAGQLTEFFIDHLFFKFMDQGRNGIKQGVYDITDTLSQWYVDCGKCTLEDLNAIHPREYNELCDALIQQFVNGFISSGSGGFSTPMSRSFHAVFNLVKAK